MLSLCNSILVVGIRCSRLDRNAILCQLFCERLLNEFVVKTVTSDFTIVGALNESVEFLDVFCDLLSTWEGDRLGISTVVVGIEEEILAVVVASYRVRSLNIDMKQFSNALVSTACGVLGDSD